MVLDELKEIEYYATSLAKGIDPTSKIAFKEDTILLLPKIIEYNKKVCDLVSLVKCGKKNKNKLYTIPFRLTDNEKQSFNFSDDEISISRFCMMINNQFNSLKGMDKLKGTEIVKGLIKKGYLKYEEDCRERKIKVPTVEGVKIGIRNVIKKNEYGNDYCVNLYNINAQRFIIDNINEILYST